MYFIQLILFITVFIVSRIDIKLEVTTSINTYAFVLKITD